jgi:anthranilate phosphoribosyltransferase
LARRRNAPESDTLQQEGNTIMADVFTELDDAGLADALSGARTRGIYAENILSFLNSGRRGVEVNLSDGIHAGKKPQSIKTGYETARENIAEGKVQDAPADAVDAAKQTKVIMKNDRVFLVRQEA